MNEKLKAILLQLAAEPSSLKTVQNSLNQLLDNGLEDWGKNLKNAIQRSQAVINITGVFKHLFAIIPKNKQGVVTNELLKPLVLAQAKLPADQRASDFYFFLHNCSTQNQWEIQNKESGWLPRILMELSAKDLNSVFNQASPAEFNQLFTYFKDYNALERLPDEVFVLFLQKLPFGTLKELELAKMAERSGSVWDALAEWFDQSVTKPLPGFWEFVQEQQLIKIAGFVEFLAMKAESTLDLSRFSIDNLHTDIPIDYLSTLTEFTNLHPFHQLTLVDQILAYGFLAVCIGRKKILRMEIQTNSQSSGEAISIEIERAEAVKILYEKISPFLKLLAETGTFPLPIIQALALRLGLPKQDVQEYLQTAECLPRPEGVPINKLEAQALTPKPKHIPSSPSPSPFPMPPPLPLPFSGFPPISSPLPLPFNSVIPEHSISTSYQFSHFTASHVPTESIEINSEADVDDMIGDIMCYVTGLLQYDGSKQSELID